MRFDEVVIDRKADANARFLKYFKLSNDAKFSIDTDGYVSTSGTITLNVLCKKLPIKFKHVLGNLVLRGAGLETLEGCPELVIGNFHCDNNKLTSFIHGPKAVKGDFNGLANPITSVDGLPEEIDGVLRFDYEETLPLIKVLLVKGVKDIVLNSRQQSWQKDSQSRQVNNILRKYVGQGKKGALLCAVDLIKAGFKENARR